MASLTRYTGFGSFVAPTLYTTADYKAFLITVKDNGGNAIDISAEDDGANEVVEAVMREVSPLMYQTANDTSGKIYVVCHGHGVDAASLQIRLRALGTSVGPNTKDVSGTTVGLGTSMVIA